MTWDDFAARIAYCYTLPTPEPLNTLATVAYAGGAVFFGSLVATRLWAGRPGGLAPIVLMLCGLIALVVQRLFEMDEPPWLVARGLGATLFLVGFLRLWQNRRPAPARNR
jgi:hypothetical protein